MANEKWFRCRYVKNPTTALGGVTHARVVPTTSKMVDPGDAGSVGPAETQVTDKGVSVEVYGNELVSLLAAVGIAAANVVIGVAVATGTSNKITIKNVVFDEIVSGQDVPAKDAGGKLPTCGIRGTAQWGAEDTFATMVVEAADT